MTTYAEFQEAVNALTPAEAFEAASRIEHLGVNLPAVGIKKLPNLLLNFAIRSESVSPEVDSDRVSHFVNLVETSTVLEISHFTATLGCDPAFRPQ